MAEWTDAKRIIGEIQKRHVSESGKVIQKLLALTLLRLGYGHIEERAVQGVDIDVMNEETGERHAFEVKTSRTTEVLFGQKDTQGLKSREADGYETFFAVLCEPLCFSHGWIVVPASEVREGAYKAVALLRRRDDHLCERINEVFPDVAEEVGSQVIECSPGTALQMLKDNWGI